MEAISTPSSSKLKILRRYTDLTAAIDFLTHRRLTLLDPASWDDRNDSHFLQRFKAMTGAKTVLALCMSSVGETYHHWRVFCGHSSGVCIEFDRRLLLEAVKHAKGLRKGEVRYMTLDKIKDTELVLRDLPFIKRWAFRHEREYRLIYESETAVQAVHFVGVPLAAIRGVTLSPWLPPGLLASTRDLLNSIPGCAEIRVSRSELISNEEWKNHADRLLSGHHLAGDPPLNPGGSMRLSTETSPSTDVEPEPAS
ncbi:MAG: DUF2971 domain-containing protein [Devosia sp.]|nr:DUF2971 domain-containing protein [Devosia sp.]